VQLAVVVGMAYSGRVDQLCAMDQASNGSTAFLGGVLCRTYNILDDASGKSECGHDGYGYFGMRASEHQLVTFAMEWVASDETMT
jgi:hypothetical protein